MAGPSVTAKLSQPETRGGAAGRGPRRLRSFGISPRTYLALLCAPAIIFVMVFYVLPTMLNFFYSFTNWNSYHSGTPWVGLKNFRELSSEGTIWNDLKITIEYAILVMVFENVFALGLALALEKTNRINGVLRTIFFLPVLFSTLTVGYVWDGILQPNGPLNDILGVIIQHPVNIAWLANPTWSLVVLSAIHAWRFGGIAMLVYIAALNGIPREFIEAARVEGANLARIIWHIKLPLIGPAFTFNLTLSLIGTFSIWELIFATTAGGPAGSTEVLNIFVWREYGYGAFGYATAASLVLFLVVVATAIPMIAYLRRREVRL
jgi:raffinose/stachyose/melibiose transport system permease protein